MNRQPNRKREPRRVDFRGLSREGAPYVGPYLQKLGFEVQETASRVTIGKPSKQGGTSFHSLYMYKNSGYWRDEAEGRRGDLVELIRHMTGCARKTAIEVACLLAGRTHPYEERP